jgi:NAD+ diphosphatase
VTVPGPPLAVSGYDRATHHRTDPEWLAAAWERCRVVAITKRTAAPTSVGSDGAPHLVYRAPVDIPADAPRRFLGLADDVPYFTATVEPDEASTWLTVREIGPRADDLEAGLLVSAIALEQWHARHGFCPRCGAPTLEAQAGWTRVCTADSSEHFPRTDPAVIMLIHDGGDLALLGRGPQWGEGRFSTLAGFVEPGESIEAAVAREVYEEVGVAITDITYLASQPWPFPASLMLGFVARLDGDPALTLDTNEMAEAGWFTRDEVRQAADWTDEEYEADPERRLRAIPPHFSISRYLIDRWLAGEV